jgi:hypothetical protein
VSHLKSDLAAVFRLQLLHDATHVNLDGALAEIELMCDDFVRFALLDGANNGQFSVRYASRVRRWLPGPKIMEVLFEIKTVHRHVRPARKDEAHGLKREIEPRGIRNESFARRHFFVVATLRSRKDTGTEASELLIA